MIGGREGGLEGVSTDSKGLWLGREHMYSGTETGDTQVGVRSIAEKKWTSVEGVLGKKGDASLRRTFDRKKGAQGGTRINT